MSGIRRAMFAVLVVSSFFVGSAPGSVVPSTRPFRGVNWADQRDNFVPDNLVLGGLDASDTYDIIRAKAHAILSGFTHDLSANTVRLPVNYPTVSGAYWAAYAGAIDEASQLGMNVVLSYWESSASKDGKVDDLDQFWSMWRIIVDRYRHDGHIYFEPMNEPHGYTNDEWMNLAAAWLERYSAIPRGRVIVSGAGYNQRGAPIGADPRFDGCLISIHIYGFWHKDWTSTQPWKDALDASVGPYRERTLITEFGAPMTTSLDYDRGPVGGPADHFLAFMQAVPARARELGLGTIYWPGLRIGDSYSLETLHGSGTHLALTLNNATGRDRLRYSWGL